MSDAENIIGTLRAEVAELRARIDAFERILQLRDAAIAQAAPAPPPAPAAALPTTHTIEADQLLPVQDGFYQLEWGPEGAFRWTGPREEVHFEAWIDRSAPLVATVQLFHLGTPANGKDMAVVVDGAAYPLLREGTSKVLKSEPIAPRAGDGPTRFTLRVPHMHSPSARGAADKRQLGVAFQRLIIARG
ncbi:hypothetical protein KPL78_01510 [Roseomonas sp. HJA6]|uniref:Uncharacterized protein n=1 Tax=Roseomonas alba TaxID=2846776 RepID=A0ABS7A2J4_9PROT|nr:hypothetical protein [Neoroseomonas alba]MBW6396498.1 hypothetical protein [Neoroseomonas alba]